MEKSFAEELADLINKYLKLGVDKDELISAMEFHSMALEEEE